MELGDIVRIKSTGYIGVVTDMRIGRKATTGMSFYHDRPETPLPDYIEIDEFIQVHPEKVERYED